MAKVYPGPEATIKNITSPWTRRKVSTLTRLEMPEKTKVDALTHRHLAKGKDCVPYLPKWDLLSFPETY